MKFSTNYRLRTVFIILTLFAIALGAWLQRSRRLERQRLHRESFLRVSAEAKTIGDELEAKILELPQIASELKAANPIDPKMALSHSHTGTSMSFGQARFHRFYHYFWQVPGGRHEVLISIAAEVQDDARPHTIRVAYLKDPINSAVGQWVEKRLARIDEDINIQRVVARPVQEFSFY